MLGGSSCCGSATGGAKNTKKKVVKPKKRVVKKIKGGNTETEPVPGTVNEPGPEPGPEPVLGTGGAKKTKKRVVKPKKIVKKYGNRKGGYTEKEKETDTDTEEDGEEDENKDIEKITIKAKEFLPNKAYVRRAYYRVMNKVNGEYEQMANIIVEAIKTSQNINKFQKI